MSSTDHERRDALPVGTVLREFIIEAVIGHGGFGIVYRAGHNELDLTVAIKEYLPVELAVREGATVQPRSGTDREDFENGLRRFRDEAQALIDFESHPSIVSCREFFRAHGTAYLVMAYEDGQSLAELLAGREAEGRPFTASDLLAVMTPLLEGLARVHAAGVLHRDIKPSNILIRQRDGRPVLIDFGAAKQATARFSKSQAPYTEGYAAMEQVADAGKLGPWTDMYGAGAVMWRIVAGGNRPWEPPHPLRVELRSHAALGETDDPLPSASELGKGRFPPQVLKAIDRCLRLRETERIQGSSELLEALRALSDEPPMAGLAEDIRPLANRSVANRQERRSHSVPAVPERSAGWRRVGWIALASLSVVVALVVPSWWGPDSAESAQYQGPDGASDGPGGEAKALERGDAFDTAPTPNWRSPNRESTTEAERTAQAPDPIGNGSGPVGEDSEVEIGRGEMDSLKAQPQRRHGAVTQPWIRDWDALDDINHPDFAAMAQAYVEQYAQIPEASVWVAQAEGILAKLREFGGTVRDQGPDGVSGGGEVPAKERGWALNSAPSPSQKLSNRESPPEANGPTLAPTVISSRLEDELSGAGIGLGSDDSLEVRLEHTKGSFVQPWIRDWDALDDTNDPGFAATARAYIEQYKQVPEASVWVARAEALLAQPRGLEVADRPPREVGDSWSNSLGMEFAWIPAGGFLMGSPNNEGGRQRDERQHGVRISEGFWMKTHEVTQGEWVAVMGENPSRFKRCGGRCPVERVSWDDAQEYIRRLNGWESRRGYRYRLPTEAEWEYAARAGTVGPRYGKLNEVAWRKGWTSSNRPKPVALKQANEWGLHDMLGNVWEWTADWYGMYPVETVKDPHGPGTGSHRVRRGGSWNALDYNVRSAARSSFLPGRRVDDVGFRLVRTE